MIHGVKIKQLKFIADDRGRLMELFRSDWPEFIKFGQLCITTAEYNVAKAWHYHKLQTDSFLCFLTPVKVAPYDARPESPTYKELMDVVGGPDNPVLIQIPPFVHHGFLGIAQPESMVINVPTELFQYKIPDEFRKPFNGPEIGYQWGEGVRGG